MKQIAGDSIIQLNIKLSQFRQLEHTIFDLTTIVDKQHISENSGLWKTSNIKQQSHMIQPMDPYQLWEERAIHLQVGGQQQAMGHKSRLPQKSQPHRIIPFMLIGHQTPTPSHSIQMVVVEECLKYHQMQHILEII